MAKEMLINVSEGEECRIALVEDGKLEELYMERTSSTSHVGNIYKGKVTNVEASIQAAFVDFGLGRNGFLHISDLMPSYFGRKGEDIVETVGKKMARRDRPPIQRCLRRGDEIVVQIIKEGIGTKGPTLSSYLSIPGKYLVMMPGVGKMGVSQKIEDDGERRRLRQILDGLEPPEGVGFIIRTAGVGKTKVEIERDLKYLTRVWENIVKKRNSSKGPTELYTEGDLVTRTVRDVFTGDVERIVVDSPEVAERVKEVIRFSSPRTKNRVELYEDKVPLFHRYGIEREIELMYSRHVPLPSGGSLVIDSTEAIVAIDVNSGKFRDHSDAETTAFKTDLEAADEIARQLRLRDLGGVIICDFIDLRYERHRRELEERLLNHLKNDRAKTKMLRMSQFGIIEMTRQRMRPSLKRAVYFDCPHCKGAGLVKTHESMSLDVMRKLAIAISDLKVVRAELSINPEVAFYLQNKNRRQIANLEDHFNKKIVVKADASLGLDEMKLDLYDNRDGLVVLDQLALTSAPHTSQMRTRPHGGPQQGGGGAGRPPQQQGGRRGQPQQGRRGGPPREDVLEEERYAIDRDEEDEQSMQPQSPTAPDREADSDEAEYDREPQRQQPQQRGGGDRDRGRQQWDNRGRDDRGGRGERQGQGGGGGRGDARPAGGQQQGRRDNRQPQGAGGHGGENNARRGGGGGDRAGGGQHFRGRRDQIIDERDERGRGIESGGEDVVVDEAYDNTGAAGGANGAPFEDDRGVEGGGGENRARGEAAQGQSGVGGEGGEGGPRRRRRRRGRRGRGRGGQGGGDLNQQPAQGRGPVQALDGYPAGEAHDDDRDSGDENQRYAAEGLSRDEDTFGSRDAGGEEAPSADRGGRDDSYRPDDDREADRVMGTDEDRDRAERDDHAGFVELGEAPAAVGSDDEDDTTDVPAAEDVAAREVTPAASEPAEAEPVSRAKPARGRRGGGGRRTKAEAATASDAAPAGEGEAAAPAKRTRSRAGSSRGKGGKAAASEASAGGGAAPAKKGRGGASSRSRSRKKSTPESSMAEATEPSSAVANDPASRAGASAARIAPSVPRTGSTDKHMADDEPVEHEPVRRPRSFRDLDELPEEFD